MFLLIIVIIIVTSTTILVEFFSVQSQVQLPFTSSRLFDLGARIARLAGTTCFGIMGAVYSGAPSRIAVSVNTTRDTHMCSYIYIYICMYVCM